MPSRSCSSSAAHTVATGASSCCIHCTHTACKPQPAPASSVSINHGSWSSGRRQSHNTTTVAATMHCTSPWQRHRRMTHMDTLTGTCACCRPSSTHHSTRLRMSSSFLRISPGVRSMDSAIAACFLAGICGPAHSSSPVAAARQCLAGRREGGASPHPIPSRASHAPPHPPFKRKRTRTSGPQPAAWHTHLDGAPPHTQKTSTYRL